MLFAMLVAGERLLREARDQEKAGVSYIGGNGQEEQEEHPG